MLALRRPNTCQVVQLNMVRQDRRQGCQCGEDQGGACRARGRGDERTSTLMYMFTRVGPFRSGLMDELSPHGLSTFLPARQVEGLGHREQEAHGRCGETCSCRGSRSTSWPRTGTRSRSRTKTWTKLWYRNENPRSYQKMNDKWIVMMMLTRRTHDPMNPYTIEHNELFRKCIRGRHGCVVVDGHDIITVPETNIIIFVPSATSDGNGKSHDM
jgi:hypothetical protein